VFESVGMGPFMSPFGAFDCFLSDNGASTARTLQAQTCTDAAPKTYASRIPSAISSYPYMLWSFSPIDNEGRVQVHSLQAPKISAAVLDSSSAAASGIHVSHLLMVLLLMVSRAASFTKRVSVQALGVHKAA
jgi:hypothetical protein